MSVFLIAFFAVLFAEMGDKTQLVTLSLSSRFPPRQVLAGALGALAVITGLAVVLGEYLADLLPQKTTLLISGLFFLAAAVYIVFKKDDSEEVETRGKNITAQTFAMVFVAELGDKTQLAAVALTAAYGMPWTVFLGAMAGQLVNHCAAAYLGSRFLSRLPAKIITVSSAALFFVFGIIFIFTSYQ